MAMWLLLLLFYMIGSLYISHRLYQSFFTKYKRVIIAPLLIITSNLFIILRVIEKNSGIILAQPLTFLSDTILALCIYIFMVCVTLDIIKIIFKLIKKEYISQKVQGIIIISLAFIIVVLGHFNSHNTKIKEYNITLNKSGFEPFQIMALADIHIGSDMSVKRLEQEIELINNINPDILLIVGDIIDKNVLDFKKKYIEAFNKINIPTYVVFGNHEYYSGTQAEVHKVFLEAGFNVLIDDVAYIDEKGFYIIGRDSLRHTHSSNNERTDIEILYEKVDNKNKPVIILDHIPKTSLDGRKINADIQISGHTHNGQFFPFNLIVKKMFELSYGMINYNGFHYFVTSGLGLWGPPIRVGTDSEILLINVKGKD